MGYKIRRSLVIENATLLAELKTALTNGQTFAIPFPASGNIANAQIYIREMLASCDAFDDILEGQLTGLRSAVRISLDYKLKAFLLNPSKPFLKGEIVLTTQQLMNEPLPDEDFMAELRAIEARKKATQSPLDILSSYRMQGKKIDG